MSRRGPFEDMTVKQRPDVKKEPRTYTEGCVAGDTHSLVEQFPVDGLIPTPQEANVVKKE